MSENSLVPQDIVDGTLTTGESFQSIVSGGDYLPRLQLFGSKSDACAEGKIGIGHYGSVKDSVITDLSPEVDIVIIGWRPKALQIDGENLVIAFHPNIVDGKITDPLFKKIVDKAGIRNSGCMYGPEFLVWIPSITTFATYHMNNPTNRREARNMEPLLGKAATLKCRLIDQGKYKWHGPVILPCSAPIEMPSDDEIREQFNKFKDPPQNDVELAENTGGERAR